MPTVTSLRAERSNLVVATGLLRRYAPRNDFNGTLMNCPLCGLVVHDLEAAKSCCGCPGKGDCGMLRCPQCGYEWVQESRLVNGAKQIWARWKEMIGHGKTKREH